MSDALDEMFVSDPTASFEHGLSAILAGLRSIAHEQSQA
jgi:hypothetical protein